MLNLSDKELDRLSREAAEKYEVEQNPAAWHKLEQLLEKELGRSSPMPRFSKPGAPFLYAPAVVILITSAYFLLKPTKHKETSTQKNYSAATIKVPGGSPLEKSSSTGRANPADKAAIKPIDPSVSNTATPNAADRKSNPSPKETTQTEAQRKLIPQINSGKPVTSPETGSATANHPTKKDRTLTEKVSENEASAINNEAINTAPGSNIKDPAETHEPVAAPYSILHDKSHHKSGKTSYQKNKSANNKPVATGQFDRAANTAMDNTTDPFAVSNAAASSLKIEQELKPATTSGLQPLFENSAYSFARNIRMKSSDVQQDIVNPGKKRNGRTSHTNNSLQIGFLISPDFSEVKYNYNNKVGSNIGITLGYQLSGRLSLNTGFVYTIKNYNAQGRDFHAPPGYWPNMYHLDFVEGNCHMFEIPLNLRYDFNKAGNTSFFISSGLSSYLMRKEHYRFFAHNNNIGFAFWDDRTSDLSHNYWFSALNLSAGFETKISNSFSFQVEPYMKLPMTGIGLGKVDLSSYGINFQIKYAPVLKRSRR